jgi:hypothetical protein
LHYFRQTAVLLPHDARMWTALANCLEKLQRAEEAIECLVRAETCEPSHTDEYLKIVKKIAEYYGLTDDRSRSAMYYAKLMASPLASATDVMSAMMCCAYNDLEEGQTLMRVPVRSRSFEPGQHAATHADGADSATTTGVPARASLEWRVGKAQELLSRAIGYEQKLQDLAAGVAAIDQEALHLELNRLNQEIRTLQHYIEHPVA